jgi:hypothetical protein
MTSTVPNAVNPSPLKRPQQLYRLYDDDGGLLYVGISYSAIARFAQHRASKPWIADVARIDIETHYVDRAEIERIERQAIADERPLHNVVHNRRSWRADVPLRDPVTGEGAMFDHWLVAARANTHDQYAALARALRNMWAVLATSWDPDVDASDTDQLRELVDEMLAAHHYPDMHHECRSDEMPPVQYPVSRDVTGHCVYICDTCGKPWSCWWRR